MIATMIYKLTKDATPQQLQEAGLGEHYANHDSALYYNNASGVPWTAAYIASKGDPLADLYEDIAAEEKARATYQWIIDMTDDVDLQDSLKFLREREIVHSMRFKEAVEIIKADRDTKKVFWWNSGDCTGNGLYRWTVKQYKWSSVEEPYQGSFMS